MKTPRIPFPVLGILNTALCSIALATPGPQIEPPAQSIPEAIELCRQKLSAPIHRKEGDDDAPLPIDEERDVDQAFAQECICVKAVYDHPGRFANEYCWTMGVFRSRDDLPEEYMDESFSIKAFSYACELWPIMKDETTSWFITLLHPRQNDMSFTFRVMRDGTVYKLVETQ